MARAVRHESAAAIMRWWVASPGTVAGWRRVLGPGRIDNQSTRRLIRAAFGRGGEAFRAYALTVEEVECRRQTTRGLGLAAHL